MKTKYSRVLLKLSGESLMGNSNSGIDAKRVSQYAEEIASIVEKNVQVAVVIGGGNIFRGLKGAAEGFDRLAGDYMGMLATVINSIALQSALKERNIKSQLLSGIKIESLTEKMYGPLAIDNLEQGKVVIISGGTGNPYFTTDTASALRALEINADVFLKGTRVPGVFDDDPEKNPNARMYDRLTFSEAYKKELKVMDLTAFTLCENNNLPVVVFDMNEKGNLVKLINGDKIGTLIVK
jgi:uridylate kinase